MENSKQQKHAELEMAMVRVRAWMSDRSRTEDKIREWYPRYKKLVDEITQLEEEMWGPIPW